MSDQRDPVMEAKQRLQASLEKLPGWEITGGLDYSSDRELYWAVKDVWKHNFDATDPRHYTILTTQTLLLRRWEEFSTLAHLHLFGPKGSGKNTALEIFQALAPRPLLVTGPSVNSIYQVVNDLHPTLCMNEVDRLGAVKEASDYVQCMLQILNVYKKGEVTLRGTQEGIVRVYDLFCPKILAGIEALPGSLPDRTIRIDCEKNANPDIPVDIEIPDTLKGQLIRYSTKHEEYNGLSKEQLKAVLGDNRITQLYYPHYVVCPEPTEQKIILDLAAEQLNERTQEEGYTDLSQIVEEIAKLVEKQANATVATVVSDVQDRPPYRILMTDLSLACEIFVPPGRDGKKQDVPRWLGWRLKRLQLHTVREGHSNERNVIVPVRILGKKLRRYAPTLLHNENNGNNGRTDQKLDIDAIMTGETRKPEIMPNIVRKPYKCGGYCKQVFPSFQDSLGHKCEPTIQRGPNE